MSHLGLNPWILDYGSKSITQLVAAICIPLTHSTTLWICWDFNQDRAENNSTPSKTFSSVQNVIMFVLNFQDIMLVPLRPTTVSSLFRWIVYWLCLSYFDARWYGSPYSTGSCPRCTSIETLDILNKPEHEIWVVEFSAQQSFRQFESKYKDYPITDTRKCSHGCRNNDQWMVSGWMWWVGGASRRWDPVAARDGWKSSDEEYRASASLDQASPLAAFSMLTWHFKCNYKPDGWSRTWSTSFHFPSVLHISNPHQLGSTFGPLFLTAGRWVSGSLSNTVSAQSVHNSSYCVYN